MTLFSVSELNEQIKSLLESHFISVYVEGEVSRPTYHGSGHLYFSLKDSDSVVKCVMFRSSVAKLRFRLEEGQKVMVGGKIGVYSPRGEYQLYATHIEPAGIGALKMAFEQLRERLKKMGYFENKKPIPKDIEKVAIVTSLSGAALSDMKRVLKKRWNLVKVYVVDTLVQGKDAAPMIADAIAYADTLGVDAIIVSRGGGSLEDLWAFNEEVVAEAIYRAKTPVISAVGHERDYLISDFVADLRAPTPSAAIEMIFPDRGERLLYLDELMEQFDKRFSHIFYQKSSQLEHLRDSLSSLSPTQKLSSLNSELLALKASLNRAVEAKISKESALPAHLKDMLSSSIDAVLQNKEHALELLGQKLKGALKARELPPGAAQVVKDGRPVELEELKVGDEAELQSLSRRVRIKVTGTDEI